MNKRRLTFPLIVTLTLLAAATLLGLAGRSAPPAPEVEFALLDGRRLSLAELRGRPVVVHFWATTCGVCRRKIPQLKDLYRELQPRGLALIAVAMPYDPPDRVLGLTRSEQLPYPVALDISADVVSAFGNVSLTPTTFLISTEGRILYHEIGEPDFDRLRQRIREQFNA